MIFIVFSCAYAHIHGHVDSKNLPDYDHVCVCDVPAESLEKREYQSLDDILVFIQPIIIAVL